MKNYVVQEDDLLDAQGAPNDILFVIAKREYGDGVSLTSVIERQNHVDRDLIRVGQQLLIPYVTFRHFVGTRDSTAARQQITEHYYGTRDPNVQLMWEIVNGVAQREIELGAWLHIPDLANVGHHTIVAGETLVELAARWFGDDRLASVIALANNLPPNTDVIPGQVLIVPGLNRRAQVAGHTLESLCREEYGDADLHTRVSVVAAANHIHDERGDHTFLFSNQVIYFPS